jgi:competence ComEA-like helix-hairpin-helix protein
MTGSLRYLSWFAILLALTVWSLLLGRSLRDPEPQVRIVVLVLFAVVIAVAAGRLLGRSREARRVGERPHDALPPTAVKGVSDDRIDLNHADLAQLRQLPGVGAVSASRIIYERETGGPFESVESLSRVAGFGPAKIRVLADLARV